MNLGTMKVVRFNAGEKKKNLSEFSIVLFLLELNLAQGCSWWEKLNINSCVRIVMLSYC